MAWRLVRILFAGGRKLATNYRKLGNRFAANEVLLDDPFKHVGCAIAVPSALGVNHSHRSVNAQLQTVRFSAIDASLFDQIQVFQSLLKVLPRYEALFPSGAFRLCLIAA